MRRREFLTFLGATAGWPLAARAQQSTPPKRLGVLMTGAESDPDSERRIGAFREGLRALGWVDGQNVTIEYRWGAGEIRRIQQYAEELVALKPDVIYLLTDGQFTDDTEKYVLGLNENKVPIHTIGFKARRGTDAHARAPGPGTALA